MYVEYDAMEQLRRDLQKGAAEVARADRNRRRRVRRARARLRRQYRWAAKNAVVAVRACARLARRSAAALLRRSIRLTQFAVEHVERFARSAVSAVGASATRISAARAERMPRRIPTDPMPQRIPDVARPLHTQLSPLKEVAPLKTVPMKTVISLPSMAPKPGPEEPADDRDAQIAELDRRQLWLRENSLGRDHADVGLLALVVARRERERGERLRARFLYERALAITARSLGPHHPEVTAVAAELADLARETGDLEQAAAWESWPAAGT